MDVPYAFEGTRELHFGFLFNTDRVDSDQSICAWLCVVAVTYFGAWCLVIGYIQRIY